MLKDQNSSHRLGKDIESLKNKIIDSALLVGLILGVAAYLFSHAKVLDQGIYLKAVTDLAVVMASFLIYIFRNRLRLRIKIIFLIIFLFSLVVTDVIKNGLVASDQVFLILIAFVALMYFRQRTSLIIFLTGLVFCLVIGYLFSADILKYGGEQIQALTRFETWIIYGLIITIVTAPIIYYSANYNRMTGRLIEDLARKNKELHEREANLESIFESTNHIIGLFDRDLNLVEYNQAFEVYARQTDQIELYKGIPVLDHMNRPQAELFRGFLSRALQGEKFSELVEYPYEGGVYFFLLSYNPIKEGTEITGVSMFVQDVTQIKKAEQEVIRERDFTNKILNLFPAIFYMYTLEEDQQAKLVRWNKNHEILLGYSAEELENKDSKDFFPEQELKKFDYLLDDIINHGQGTVEARLKHKQGHEIPHLFISTIFEEGDNRFFMGFGIDISDRIKAQEELLKYKEHLEDLVKARTRELESANAALQENNLKIDNQRKELKASLDELQKTQLQLIQSEKMASLGLLSAGVAHEINNPMNFIQNGIEGLTRHLENEEIKIEKELKLFIDFIREGVSRTSSIVKSLSQFSRQTENMHELCDVHEILDNCLVMLQHEVKQKADVVKDYHPDTLIINGNAGKLHQAFLNILINAIQAIRDQGEIRIATSIEDSRAMILFADNGVGIPEKDINQIFDPFFTRKDVGIGTGLGLSITSSIIRDHQGEVRVRSTPGKGSEFSITLPLNRKT